MSRRTIELNDALHTYLIENTITESEVMRQLRAETDELPNAEMQISPEQGQFMRLLVELLNTRLAVEVGTFTGYSALWITAGLPDDGRLICCDISEEYTAIARRYWRQAGCADRIDLRIGAALDTLNNMLRDNSETSPAGKVDFVFIDADKENSENYYELGLKLLHPGGLVAIDNAFHGGRVADMDVPDSDAPHRVLNHTISRDERVTSHLAPIGDGLLLARKK